jgi:hypothetical protein
LSLSFGPEAIGQKASGQFRPEDRPDRDLRYGCAG